MSSGNMASLSVISVLAIILLTSPVFIVGDTCIGASTDHKVYTTTDGASSTETVFLIEFTLVCKNNAKNLFLNAEVVGKQLPVSRFGDNQYQVSWTEDHKNAPPGNYDVRFYDEEGFSALRKAMRAGDDSAKVKPAFTINVAHKGVSHGPVVGTEVIASGLALLLWYSAYQAKSRIQV
ncbi:translocon-associated protein subunit delta-like isoform X2 [Acanthaster planci]|uniref:Translocon-associated protein subunit delta n=1 Tax=Acanthaster planci TaxID=133434 RepID=A0A8B7XP69_ACAPL|nr:translocon-associated protein subunit delta-like isoform X2 [Acanthaster planci]